MQTYYATVRDTQGDALTGATVTVYMADGVTVAPSIYDRHGAAQPNPLQSDSAGEFAVAAPDGTYVISVQTPGNVENRTIVLLDSTALVTALPIAVASAQANATLAQNAANAALASGQLYQTTAAGITATNATINKYFLVISTDGSGAWYLWQNVSGTATAVLDINGQQVGIPAQQAVARLNAKTKSIFSRPFSSLSSGFADKNGYLIQYTTNAGRIFDLLLTNFKSVPSAIKTRLFSSLSFAIADKNGYIKSATLNTGASIEPLLFTPVQALAASMFIIPAYGQSLSIGTSSPALTTTQPYSNVMFSSGINQQTPGAQTAFSPAIEAATSGYGETGWAAMANVISSQYPNLTKVFVGAFGVGGQPIANLSKGQPAYTNLIAGIQNAYNIAVANGEFPLVPFVPFVHGEADESFSTPSSTYVAGLTALATNLDKDIRAITGQNQPVLLVCSQTSSHEIYVHTYPTISLAQSIAAAQLPNLIRVLAPKYQMSDYGTDNPHMVSGHGYRHMGLDFARFHVGEFINRKPWQPFQPISASHKGSTVILTFNSTPTIDTVNVTEPVANARGLEIFSSAGAATINSVTLVGNNSVLVNCSAALPNDGSIRARLAYTGVLNATPGNTTGPRSCLRSSAALFSQPYNDANGNPYLLYDWAIHSDFGVS
jgi:hypothetical protein